MSRGRDEVGRIMHQRRRELGMTQQQLAEQLWRTQQWISQVERGDRHVQNLDDLRFIAHQMQMAPERFGVLPAPPATPAQPGRTDQPATPARAWTASTGDAALGEAMTRTDAALRAARAAVGRMDAEHVAAEQARQQADRVAVWVDQARREDTAGRGRGLAWGAA